ALRTTGGPTVALTFDDGPRDSPGTTAALLDELHRNGVRATFCLVGFKARDNAALVRRIVDEGHTLCNHSWQHLFDLAAKKPDGHYKYSDAYIRADLQKTNDAIRAAAPGA